MLLFPALLALATLAALPSFKHIRHPSAWNAILPNSYIIHYLLSIRSFLKCLFFSEVFPILKLQSWGQLQDGRRVRRGDHLPTHRYIRNTSTSGTAPIKHLLNAGGRPQTSQKASNSPCTWVGQKKKEKTETKNRDGTCTRGRELLGRKGFHTLGRPFAGRDCGWQRGEALEPRRRAQQQGCRGQSGEVSAQRIGADQHSPAREACLLTRRGEAGLGAEAPASEVRSQGEDWGWLREHSLKGAGAPRLAGRESRKRSGMAEEGRDFSLPLCFLVREERGFRAPPKRAPEMGASHSYQRGPQRRA